MTAPAPEEIRAARDRLLTRWAASPSRAKQVAAAWGRDLLDQPAGERAASSMKIAARYGVNNTMAVRARRYLLTAGFLHRDPGTSRYHVAVPALPASRPGPGAVARRNPSAAGIPAPGRPRVPRAGVQPR
jgi:hypothetical protein